MKCALSPEALRKVRRVVAGDILDMIKDGKILDVKEYTKEVYNKIKETTQDHEVALDVARNVPGMVMQLIITDRSYAKFLNKSKVSLDNLQDIIFKAEEDNGLKYIQEYLELDQSKLKKELEILNQAGEQTSLFDEDPVKVGDTVLVKSGKYKGLSEVIEDKGDKVVVKDISTGKTRTVLRKNVVFQTTVKTPQ